MSLKINDKVKVIKTISMNGALGKIVSADEDNDLYAVLMDNELCTLGFPGWQLEKID